MFQRKIMSTMYICPNCGSKLAHERDFLCCEKHGAFSAYGPHLLVRVPPQPNKNATTPMPWEPAEARRSS